MRFWNKNLKHILAALIGVAVLTLPMTALASAGEQIANTPDNTVNLVYRDRNDAPINNLRVRIYKVADVTGEIVAGAASGYDLTYTLTDQFRDYSDPDGLVPITGFNEERINNELIIRPGESTANRRARWQAIAQTLRPYALNDLWPEQSLYTQDGRVSFTGLYPGLYLIVTDDHPVRESDADYSYRYQSTFVALPGFENGAWDHDRDFSFDNNSALRVKYTYERQTYRRAVYKRWLNDNGTVRPAEVRVDIYRDGVLYRTVYLNADNNWRYEWESGSGEWEVVERTTGNNYSVQIDYKEGTFTIDNTYNPPPNNPPPSTPPTENPPPPEEAEVLGATRLPSYDPIEAPEVLGMRRLPQTGQLNWPVPVLAIAGLILFGTGFYRNRRNV